MLELVIPPASGLVVQRLARPSGIRETRGSIPGLALSFLLPQKIWCWEDQTGGGRQVQVAKETFE